MHVKALRACQIQLMPMGFLEILRFLVALCPNAFNGFWQVF